MHADDKRPHEAARPEFQETTKVDTRHERNGAEPDAAELRDPEEVWKDDERTPRQDGAKSTGAPGRVADAGDIGGRATTPYSTEAQADSLARQTERGGGAPKPEKPER